MQSKGCVTSLLAGGILCAFLVLGFFGLFAVKTVSVKEFPVYNGQVEVVNGNGSYNLTTAPSMTVGSMPSPSPHFAQAGIIILALFMVFAMALIFGLFLVFRRKRSVSPPNGSEVSDDVQQMYINFKRMEKRLETLETLLLEKESAHNQ
jgi:hypothetical protein